MMFDLGCQLALFGILTVFLSRVDSKKHCCVVGNVISRKPHFCTEWVTQEDQKCHCRIGGIRGVTMTKHTFTVLESKRCQCLNIPIMAETSLQTSEHFRCYISRGISLTKENTKSHHTTQNSLVSLKDSTYLQSTQEHKPSTSEEMLKMSSATHETEPFSRRPTSNFTWVLLSSASRRSTTSIPIITSTEAMSFLARDPDSPKFEFEEG